MITLIKRLQEENKLLSEKNKELSENIQFDESAKWRLLDKAKELHAENERLRVQEKNYEKVINQILGEVEKRDEELALDCDKILQKWARTK